MELIKVHSSVSGLLEGQGTQGWEGIVGRMEKNVGSGNEGPWMTRLVGNGETLENFWTLEWHDENLWKILYCLFISSPSFSDERWKPCVTLGFKLCAVMAVVIAKGELKTRKSNNVAVFLSCLTWEPQAETRNGLINLERNVRNSSASLKKVWVLKPEKPGFTFWLSYSSLAQSKFLNVELITSLWDPGGERLRPGALWMPGSWAL